MKRHLLPFTPLLLACGPIFYQAPPTIEHFPERSPTKRWQTLFQEAKPKPDGALTADGLFQSCSDLTAKLPDLTQQERIQAIDILLQQNRDGDFRLNFANFLYEMRELVVAEAPLDQVKPYFEWRQPQLRERAGFISRPPERQWDWDDKQFAQAKESYHKSMRDSLEAYDRLLKEGAKVLLPYVLVQKGATQFNSSRFEDAAKDFTEVLTNFPDHPRAEVAQLMLGRCALEQSRALRRSQMSMPDGNQKAATLEETNKQLHLATERFQKYRETYPKGRFLADTLGWMAAVSHDFGSYDKAVVLQIERLDVQSTREITRSVMRECDRLFEKMFASDEAQDWQRGYEGYEIGGPLAMALARHPVIARMFVQRTIDPAAEISLPFYWEDTSGSRETLDFLRKRIIRPQQVAKTTLTSLARAMTKQSNGPQQDPMTLLILGWASSLNGEHEQALTLFDRAIAQKPSDELLHGRAIVLNRLGRNLDAAEAFARLEQDYPKSILTTGSLFERALTRYRAGQAGKALLDLWKIHPLNNQENGDRSPSADLHLGDETQQWIDVIAQFAPMEQLYAPLSVLPPDDPQAKELRTILLYRSLAKEDFEHAKQYLEPEEQADKPPAGQADAAVPEEPADEDMTQEDSEYWTDKPLDLTFWQKEIAPLAEATQQLKKANTPERKAVAHLAVAKHWRNLRGRISLPLQHRYDFANSEPERIDLLRRQNARALGLSRTTVEQELDSRDELSHALSHFLAAADLAKDPAIACEALEGANEALFRLAEFSPYRISRAIETDANGLSARLVERLKKEFPNSKETKRAIAWTFEPFSLYGDWMPGDYSNWRVERNLQQYARTLRPKNADSDPYKKDKTLQPFEKRLHLLLEDQTKDLASYQAELTALQKDFDQARPSIDVECIDVFADDLDDLLAATKVTDLPPALFRSYAKIRLSRNAPPEAIGEWQILAPFLAFLDRICPMEGDNGRRKKADNIESWQEYLRLYPQSPKTEAVSLRLLRLKVRACCPLPHIRSFHFPEAPSMGGYKRIAPRTRAHPEDPKALTQELKRYEERFPQGRYKADLSLLRVALAIDQQQEAVALRELTTILRDPQHPELYPLAGRYLAECALKLLEKEARPRMIDALRADSQAREMVRNLALGDTCVSRIRPVLPWLEKTP